MRTAASLFFALAILSGPSPLLGADRIAVFTGPDDQAPAELFLGACRKLGAAGSDVTDLAAEDEIKLKRYSVLVVGPLATNSKAVSEWLRRSGTELRDFVEKGGTILIFNQSPDFWDIEPWLPPDAFLLRGTRQPGRPYWIAEDHPLFNVPHRLELDALSKSLPEPVPPTGSIRTVRGFRELARTVAGRPWAVETGWGRGRVVALSWSPPREDPAATTGGSSQRRANRKDEDEQPLWGLLVENVLQYSLAAARGEAPALPEEAVIKDWTDEARLRPELFTPERDKEFELEVNAAVDRGIAFLKGRQKEDGSWGVFKVFNGDYHVGQTAMALLALLVSGVSKHDASVKLGFDFMLDTPPTMTYETGLAMMALEQKAAPMYERFELERLPPEKRKSFKFQRNLTTQEVRYMEYCRDRLLSHHARGGTWYYRPGEGGGDISNGQYAVLGLKAAARCGVKVDADIWETVLNYYLTYQQPSGPATTLLRFKNFERDWTPRFYAEKAEARGWQYRFGHPGRPQDVLGTHVCIGIACSLFCYEELMTSARSRAGKYTPKARAAVQDGLAWLQRHWSVDHVPNGEKFYYYYYIYSLERVGVLTERRFIGDHDWYREGGTYLLAKQNDDGSWHSRGGEYGNPVVYTSFALLFLKRSTPPPVITVGK